MLPKINGFEVVRRVRRESILTPILLLTAKDQLEDRGKPANPILSCEILGLLREPVKVSRQRIPSGLFVVTTAYRQPSPCSPRSPQGAFITVTTLNNGIRLRITANEPQLIRMIHRILISNDSATWKGKK